MINNQCFTLSKVGVEGKLISKNSFTPKILEHLAAFSISALFGLPQSTIFIMLEHTSEIETHCNISGMDDHFYRMAQLSMQDINAFSLQLSHRLSKLSPLWACSLKELDSSYPTIMSLDSALQHNIATCRLYPNIVFTVIQDFTHLQNVTYGK